MQSRAVPDNAKSRRKSIKKWTVILWCRMWWRCLEDRGTIYFLMADGRDQFVVGLHRDKQG